MDFEKFGRKYDKKEMAKEMNRRSEEGLQRFVEKLGEEHDESYYAYKPITENPLVLDLTGCDSPMKIHTVLKERFGFPEYYGMNWSALWDCLDDISETPLTVQIRGLYSIPEKLNKSVESMLVVFNRVHKHCPHITFVVIS